MSSYFGPPLGGTKEEEIMGRTPASCSALHPHLEFMSGRMAAVLPEPDQRWVMAKLMVRALWARS